MARLVVREGRDKTQGEFSVLASHSVQLKFICFPVLTQSIPIC